MDQIEMLKNVQSQVATDFGMQRLLQTVELSKHDMKQRCKYQLFDALKKEVSSKLSSLDSLFNASVILDDDELSENIVKCIDHISSLLQDNITFLASNDEDEEGGDNEIS